jgi:hypothetical protein
MKRRRLTASLYRALLAVPVAGATVAIGVDDLLGARQLEVEKPVENIRSSPNGEQIGTLVKGVEVEELEQEGKWVRINVEGWIWGPSLRGFEPGEEAVDRPRETGRKEKKSTREPAVRRPPRATLHRHTAEASRIIDPEFGDFYGISLDHDLGRLVVRFKVTGISREALEVRQMRVQREVVRGLEDADLEFKSVRIETNRPDGTGEVGVEVAVTKRADIDAEDDVDKWKTRSRISTDGGKTWE